jgi:hypothetical protein
MKTRQEMVYDFMIALASNGEVFKDWNTCEFLGAYGEHIQALAEELADKYLSGVA